MVDGKKFNTWAKELDIKLENIHTENKKMTFQCFLLEIIELLGSIYAE